MYITNSNLFRYQCLVGGYSFNLYLCNDYLFNICLDSCPIGVSADSCSAGAPWMRE